MHTLDKSNQNSNQVYTSLIASTCLVQKFKLWIPNLVTKRWYNTVALWCIYTIPMYIIMFTCKQFQYTSNTSALQLGSALHSSTSTLTQDANPPWQTRCKGWAFCYSNIDSPSYISIHVQCVWELLNYFNSGMYINTRKFAEILQYINISTCSSHVNGLKVGL